MKRHCPTCCCSNDTDQPLVINVDAEFFPLVLLIDRAVWDERILADRKRRQGAAA